MSKFRYQQVMRVITLYHCGILKIVPICTCHSTESTGNADGQKCSQKQIWTWFTLKWQPSYSRREATADQPMLAENCTVKKVMVMTITDRCFYWTPMKKINRNSWRVSFWPIIRKQIYENSLEITKFVELKQSKIKNTVVENWKETSKKPWYFSWHISQTYTYCFRLSVVLMTT